MNEDKRYLSWSAHEKGVIAIAQAIEHHNEDPDYVVGIARGGLPGAIILSHALDLPFAAVEADYYDGEERNETVEVGEFTDIPTGNVVIFDDIVDTGETMAAIKSIVEGMTGNKSEVITAALNVKPDREFDPDYWVEETDAWVVYPWEVSL